MRRLLRDNNGNMVGTVAGAIAILILLMIGITAYFNMAADLDPYALDVEMQGDGTTEASNVGNATNSSLQYAAIFFQIAPIIVIVIVAVAVLGVVKYLGG